MINMIKNTAEITLIRSFLPLIFVYFMNTIINTDARTRGRIGRVTTVIKLIIQYGSPSFPPLPYMTINGNIIGRLVRYSLTINDTNFDPTICDGFSGKG